MDFVFQEVMKHLDVFADFLIVATAYGIKTHEEERVFHGWRSCCSQNQCSKAKHGKLGHNCGRRQKCGQLKMCRDLLQYPLRGEAPSQT